MSTAHQIDLSIALQKLNELALADGDLGYEYWYSISKLLKRAASMQDEIVSLTRAQGACRAKHRK